MDVFWTNVDYYVYDIHKRTIYCVEKLTTDFIGITITTWEKLTYSIIAENI